MKRIIIECTDQFAEGLLKFIGVNSVHVETIAGPDVAPSPEPANRESGVRITPDIMTAISSEVGIPVAELELRARQYGINTVEEALSSPHVPDNVKSAIRGVLYE